MSKIQIQYKNNTGSTDFEVLVFTKNYNPNTVKTYYCAWQVLKAQTGVTFDYPADIAVGATYITGSLKNTAGPFNASLGSTWEITQDTKSATPTLMPNEEQPKNPDGNIVIKNVPPTSWSGQKFDIGVYKDKRLLVTQPEVRTGDQVNFMLKPVLYFAVARNIQVGEVFTSLEITSSYADFDLSNFPNGIIVSLDQKPGGGQYVFKAESM